MDVREYIERALGGVGSSPSSKELVCDCLFCGKERHLYVNSITGLSYCFSCGVGANLAQIIEALENIDPDIAFVRAEHLLEGRGVVSASPEELYKAYMRLLANVIPGSRELPTLTLPAGCVALNSVAAGAARSYLITRGFTEQHWDRYGLSYCIRPIKEMEHMRRHIVFPHYNVSGALSFYTTRAAYEPRKRAPKSYHAKDTPRGSTLFGEYALRSVVKQNNSHLIVVEGPLDMMALSGYAVALVGKFMSAEQAAAIALRYKRVIVALDGGEDLACANAADMLLAAGVHDVSTCSYYGEGASDPGDLAVLSIRNAVERVHTNARAHKHTSGSLVRLTHGVGVVRTRDTKVLQMKQTRGNVAMPRPK